MKGNPVMRVAYGARMYLASNSCIGKRIAYAGRQAVASSRCSRVSGAHFANIGDLHHEIHSPVCYERTPVPLASANGKKFSPSLFQKACVILVVFCPMLLHPSIAAPAAYGKRKTGPTKQPFRRACHIVSALDRLIHQTDPPACRQTSHRNRGRGRHPSRI